MPIEDGDYEQRTERELRQDIEQALRDEFGDDIDLTQSSVFSLLARTIAEVQAQNQEPSLEEVYESAYLETASGESLEQVVDIIGLQRRSAVPATGVQQFDAGTEVTQNYVVQRGTRVQTDANNPIEFETTESAVISLFDDFESNDLSPYSGDTGSASIVQSPTPFEGDFHLELDATDGAHVYRDDVGQQRGSTSFCRVRVNDTGAGGTAAAPTFLVDSDAPGDHYQTVVDAINDEFRIERVEGGSAAATLDTATTIGYNADAYYEIEIRPNVTGNISAVLFDDSGTEIASVSGEDTTYLGGVVGFKSLDANGTKHFDLYNQSKVSCNIRALNGGVQGNVGPNAVTVQPQPVAGVAETTNLYAVGDPDIRGTDGVARISGKNEETDSQLRERAREAVTEGGAGTFDAIVTALVNDVQGVNSVTLFENKTDTDNTGSGGLPPHSFEAVVFGGDSLDIAETIFETKSVTARDYAGANGSTVTETVVSDSNGQKFQISFSRPTAVDVDIVLDVVVNDSYIGDEALRDDIVQYIGGTLTNGAEVEGLGVGDNVVVDQIQDIVTGADETGVVAMDESVDGDPIETTPTSSTVNGIEVVDIGDNEVATCDATDSSIAINARQL